MGEGERKGGEGGGRMGAKRSDGERRRRGAKLSSRARRRTCSTEACGLKSIRSPSARVESSSATSWSKLTEASRPESRASSKAARRSASSEAAAVPAAAALVCRGRPLAWATALAESSAKRAESRRLSCVRRSVRAVARARRLAVAGCEPTHLAISCLVKPASIGVFAAFSSAAYCLTSSSRRPIIAAASADLAAGWRERSTPNGSCAARAGTPRCSRVCVTIVEGRSTSPRSSGHVAKASSSSARSASLCESERRVHGRPARNVSHGRKCVGSGSAARRAPPCR